MDHTPNPQSVAFAEIDTLRFPSYFTACCDYMATGEGMTFLVFMGYAHDADALRRQLNERFNPYFAQGAEIWQGLQIPTAIEGHISPAVKTLCSQDEKADIGHFVFFSSFHLNLA